MITLAKGRVSVTTITAPLERREAPAQTLVEPATAPRIAGLGLAAGLVAGGWILYFDRRVAYPITAAAVSG
ncbi:MAG: hypothetical protein ACYC61_18175, partial [Isosphaeraceae bacterium]